MTRRTDTQRIAYSIARLHHAGNRLPTIRKHIDEQLADTCAPGTGGSGSGISDPVGAAVLRLNDRNTVNHHKQLNQAIVSIENAIEHLLRTLDAAEGNNRTDTSHEQRCEHMVLDSDAHGDDMRPCGRITANDPEPGMNRQPRPDGLCDDHGKDKDTGINREQNRRLRRKINAT